MADDRSIIQGNAQAIIKAVEAMPPAEKLKQPTGTFGDNFNSVLARAKELAPDVNPADWPKPFEVYEAAMAGGRFTDGRYIEAHAFAQQIYSILGVTSNVENFTPPPKTTGGWVNPRR